MSDHYGLPENTLTDLKVSVKDQFDSLILFQPKDEAEREKKKYIERPISPVGLLHYIDNCSTIFMDIQSKAHQKIAKAIFDNLDSPFKINVFQYFEMIEGENND